MARPRHPRHPNFDEMWSKHYRMVLHWDRRLREFIWNITGSSLSRGYFQGWLTIRFNTVLYSWDPNKSSFFNYFSQRIRHRLLETFMKYESESWYRFMRNIEGEYEEFEETNQNFTFHESAYHLYRVPSKDMDWAQEIISTFDSNLAAWEYFTQPLKEREKRILTRRLMHNHTLEEIGRDEKITKERVRQISDAGISRIARTLKYYEQYIELIQPTERTSRADMIKIRVRAPEIYKQIPLTPEEGPKRHHGK